MNSSQTISQKGQANAGQPLAGLSPLGRALLYVLLALYVVSVYYILVQNPLTTAMKVVFSGMLFAGVVFTTFSYKSFQKARLNPAQMENGLDRYEAALFVRGLVAPILLFGAQVSLTHLVFSLHDLNHSPQWLMEQLGLTQLPFLLGVAAALVIRFTVHLPQQPPKGFSAMALYPAIDQRTMGYVIFMLAYLFYSFDTAGAMINVFTPIYIVPVALLYYPLRHKFDLRTYLAAILVLYWSAGLAWMGYHWGDTPAMGHGLEISLLSSWHVIMTFFILALQWMNAKEMKAEKLQSGPFLRKDLLVVAAVAGPGSLALAYALLNHLFSQA